MVNYLVILLLYLGTAPQDPVRPSPGCRFSRHSSRSLAPYRRIFGISTGIFWKGFDLAGRLVGWRNGGGMWYWVDGPYSVPGRKVPAADAAVDHID